MSARQCDPLSQMNSCMTSGPLLDNGLPPISLFVFCLLGQRCNVELAMQGKRNPDGSLRDSLFVSTKYGINILLPLSDDSRDNPYHSQAALRPIK